WDELLLDPSGDLRNILLKHVYPDNIMSTGLLNGLQLVMQNGEAVIVTTSGNSIFLDDAEIIMRDIVTDNGIVHVIDAVLVEIIISNTIFDIVANSPDHTILEDLLIQAGLDFALRVNEPITLFAPTDAAFNALSDEVMNELLSDPSGLLRDLLLYHTTNTLIGSSDLSDQLFIIMGTGESSKITINNDGTFINNAKFLVVDIIADNGIVNIIDAVLEPLISGVDNQDLAELKIYPNPVSDVLNIEDSGYYKLISSVSIYDAKGRLIQKVTDNTNNNQIDVSTLESGLYYIIINDHEVLHPFIKH
ncbi:MAG: T9SS type A sorting domain-containing protein, partial [Saprospiraceae bacterium]|nr:T9SS type A sorting domain-containing protein [Saprospiraceae bacterium]